ncbi:MAG: TIR domain-containing protein, partial [Ktedonobacterales bacterium]
MSKIFISYRREDSGAACGHIYDRLKARFGKENIFKDVDSIPYGVSFPDYIAQKMAECSVALILIGPTWVSVTKDGRQRLADPADNVRVEVEKALDRFLTHEMLVMPVLVQNATIPDATRLPENIRLLCKINGPQIHDDPYFDFDMQRLMAQIEPRLGVPAPAAAPAPATPAPVVDAATERVRQATPLIEAAVAAGDWIQVLDRCRVLKASSGHAIPVALWLAYGRACLEEGEPAEGRSALDTALKRAPDNLEVLRALARACHAVGDDAAADTHLRQALGGPVTTTVERLEVLREYLPVLDKLQNWNELLRRATEGGRLAPDESRWLRGQLRALRELHREPEALTVARALTTRADATAGDWLTRSRLAYAVAGNTTTDEVRAALDAAARLVPNEDPALAQARHELLPPPPPQPPQRVTLPPNRLPPALATLGFAGYAQGTT